MKKKRHALNSSYLHCRLSSRYIFTCSKLLTKMKIRGNSHIASTMAQSTVHTPTSALLKSAVTTPTKPHRIQVNLEAILEYLLQSLPANSSRNVMCE